MNQRQFNGKAVRLRSAKRVALLEVDRVVDLCTTGISAKSVIDIGTGSGLFAERFYTCGLDVAGIDVNTEMVRAARDYVPQGQFMVATAESLPFEVHSFDIVFLGLVLHESDFPERVLKEAKRIARKRVAILEWPYLEEESGPPLSHRLKSDDILALAKKNGFCDIKHVFLKRNDSLCVGCLVAVI